MVRVRVTFVVKVTLQYNHSINQIIQGVSHTLPGESADSGLAVRLLSMMSSGSINEGDIPLR